MPIIAHGDSKENRLSGKTTDSLISEIKNRLPFLEVLQALVPVERLTIRGNRAVGLCPLHSEKTPSFTVYLDQNRFYCFGCHAQGDVIDLYSAYKGVSVAQAIKELSSYLGLSRTLSPAEQNEAQRQAQRRKRERLIEGRLEDKINEVTNALADEYRIMERYLLIFQGAGQDPLKDSVASWWMSRRDLYEHWLNELLSGDKLRQLEALGEVVRYVRTLS